VRIATAGGTGLAVRGSQLHGSVGMEQHTVAQIERIGKKEDELEEKKEDESMTHRVHLSITDEETDIERLLVYFSI
jgi:hypothetical protein